MNPGSNLSWSHYRLLLTIKDENKRKEYEHIVETEGLSKRELEELIKKEKNKKNSNKTAILVEKRGLLNLHKLSKIENISITTFYLDLGFRVYLDKLEKANNAYTDGSIVRVKESKNDYNFTLMNEDQNNKLYTYKGFIKEIVDGDTLWVILELGFNTWTTKKVRLRGINAASVETPPGKKAKKFISDQLKPCSFVIVKTYWRDKYNRYLADIFYDKNEGDANVVAEKGTYLNQLLLDKGLARKYSL